jgi:two-component system capsular synthesis sensor histidine kinase RcsC
MTPGTHTLTGRASPLLADVMETHYPVLNRQGSHHLRSLVVDDDQTILSVVARMLSKLGYHGVETAQKKSEAMTKLTLGPYDLLVTDLEMPDMNGYHLTQKIKNERGDTKVIIMTGHAKHECQEMMVTRWVDGWLFKPFGLMELRKMLLYLGF